MLDIILASGNAHKAEEFAELFDSNVIKVSAAADRLEVDETGVTYSENALLKAQAYYEKYKKPVLADDSGLNVSALPDELGIYSARFGGEGLSDRDRVNLLLEKMKDQSDKQAYFTCVLCFYLSPQEIFFFEGKMEGIIGSELKGKDGFGYDPAFHPNGPHADKTVAELPEWKNKNSHRAFACQHAEKFFKER